MDPIDHFRVLSKPIYATRRKMKKKKEEEDVAKIYIHYKKISPSYITWKETLSETKKHVWLMSQTSS